MNFSEFKNYIEQNCRAQDIFISKATLFQQTQNAKRSPKQRWSNAKIANEVDKMWISVVKNMHENIKSSGKIKKHYDHNVEIESWISFINEEELLDSFVDSIDEIEFE